MDVKHDLEGAADLRKAWPDSKDEKFGVADSAPPYDSGDGLSIGPDNSEWENLGFWTRNGCTPESFKRRKGPVGSLNATMKPRHLHMIAIGGSIGAGLFVGSGSALSDGVRKIRMATFA